MVEKGLSVCHLGSCLHFYSVSSGFIEEAVYDGVAVLCLRKDALVGLYDKVTVYMPDDDETQVIQVVTTVRTDPLKGLISRESPFGKAVLGKRTGDRVLVQVNDHCSYEVEIRSVEKSEDDGSAPILQY